MLSIIYLTRTIISTFRAHPPTCVYYGDKDEALQTDLEWPYQTMVYCKLYMCEYLLLIHDNKSFYIGNLQFANHI